MAIRTTAMAKFSCPNPKGVLQRKQLFKTINSFENMPVIWIQSPAGAGKTTLVSSYLESMNMPCLWYQMDEGDADLASFFYFLRQAVSSSGLRNEGESRLQLLTSEYLPCLSLFARRFFEELFREIGPVKRLVIDNYQAVSGKTGFHKVILHGLEVIPPQCQVVMISRQAPPAEYVRLRVNGDLAMLAWEHLRLSLDESREIAKLRGCHYLNDRQIAKLHDYCEGWAAGLVLLLEATQSLKSDRFIMNSNSLWEDIFNYFAGEVFEHMAPDVRNLLLKTAYLPKVHALHASRLTGYSNADALLLSLSRNQYFITPYNHEEPVYHYHQLFRQFLITENDRRTDAHERNRIQHLSAQLLLESGNTEEAAALFVETKDWSSITKIIMTNAERLLKQGRQEIISGWIDCLPAGHAAQSPWIAYWRGACMVTTDPIASRAWFGKAFDEFKKANDIEGVYQAWAGVVDTFIYIRDDLIPLDDWINALQPLLHHYPLPPGPIKAKVTLAMFCALIYRCPHHPEMQMWEEALKRIIQDVQDANLKIMLSSHLLFYYTYWIGAQEKASFLINIMKNALKDKKVTPLQYIGWRSRQGVSLWMRNQLEASHQVLSEGLAVAKATGVHFWDYPILVTMTYWHLCRRKIDDAETYLAKIQFILDSNRRFEISHFHMLSANIRLCQGKLSLAMEHINTAIAFARKSGCLYAHYYYLTAKADILIEAGEYARAEGLLQEAFEFGRLMRSSILKDNACWLQALMHHKQGNSGKMHCYLKIYLQSSKANGTVNHAWWRSTAMIPLFLEALNAGIEVEHVQRLIREFAIHPPKGIPLPDNWPYAIRIHTFGGFSLTVDGQPVTMEMKGKNKPLQMLKMLASQAGASDTCLADALWPDADGDAALQSFTVTLHRLRKYIGHQEAVLLKAHQIRLNPDLCWSDLSALNRLLDRADRLMRDRQLSAPELMRMAEALQAAYKGPFLPGEALPLLVGVRQRLNDRWAFIVKPLGKNLEHKASWDAAARLYAHTLHMDELAEWACQGVLRCGLQSGQWADALVVYQRFKKSLDRTFGTVPSPQTEDLKMLLQAQTN